MKKLSILGLLLTLLIVFSACSSQSSTNETVYELKIVDKEVIAYHEDGTRRMVDHCFVEYEGNTYYAVNNFIVIGQWVIENKAYSFDENGVLMQDVILDEVFIQCEGATYYIVNNVTVYNQVVIDGAVYDFGADGKMVTGTKGEYTYGEDGKLIANEIFITINNYTYYIINNVTVHDQIVINGSFYFFDEEGKMFVGEKDGYTYGEDGKLIADKIFLTINNDIYYFVNNIMVYNQFVIDGNVYDFGEDGKMFVGEKDGYTYGEDGKLIADKIFLTINNFTYYIINNITVYNQIVINGAIYDFGEDGKMVVSEKDGYIYGEDGKLIANEIFITINNCTYYMINNVIVYNQIVINGAIYDFGEDGKMVVGEKDGYIYGEDGKLIANEIFITINNYTYYIINNITVYNQIIINGAVYDFGEDGKMVIGTKGEYTYGEDGKLIANEIFITINNFTYYIINNVTVYNRVVINGAVYDFGTDGKMVIGENDGYTYGEDGKLIVEGTVHITVNNKIYVVINNVLYEGITLTGTIYESDGDRDPANNATLSGVAVTLIVDGAQFAVQTDDTGKFIFENIPMADGTLTAAMEGYFPAQMHASLGSGEQDVTIIMDRQVSNNLSGYVYIADTDNSLSNNAYLTGAALTLSRISSTNPWSAQTVSDSNGYYSFSDLTAGMYKLTITKDGYLPIEQIVQVKYNETNVYNIGLEVIPATESDGYGYASGKVTDARTGNAVSGLSVYIYPGINNIDGNWLCKTTTDANGGYTTEQLQPGNYTAYVVDERELANEDYRYGAMTIALKVMPNATISNQNATVSNKIGLSADGIRIVLTWGSTPNDLDSHMKFGSYHVYYSNKSTSGVQLDVDDTSAYGPETITISSIENYTYNYYIYNYSNSGTMANAQATITVYFGNSNEPAYTFHPPVDSGYYWNVFSFNGATGEFIIHNTVSDYAPS